MHNIHTLS